MGFKNIQNHLIVVIRKVQTAFVKSNLHPFTYC